MSAEEAEITSTIVPASVTSWNDRQMGSQDRKKIFRQTIETRYANVKKQGNLI